jgi:hypothetical protein
MPAAPMTNARLRQKKSNLVSRISGYRDTTEYFEIYTLRKEGDRSPASPGGIKKPLKSREQIQPTLELTLKIHSGAPC